MGPSRAAEITLGVLAGGWMVYTAATFAAKKAWAAVWGPKSASSKTG